jgi:hypothetical protein
VDHITSPVNQIREHSRLKYIQQNNNFNKSSSSEIELLKVETKIESTKQVKRAAAREEGTQKCSRGGGEEKMKKNIKNELYEIG